jgi:PIN domain nuclease of toxin-antitoxin system
VILLDTNAILFLLTQHRRAKPLASYAGQLRVSPLSLFELQVLHEVGRLRISSMDPREAFAQDPRWGVDDPQVGDLVHHALDVDWTRDPFDRMLVAHARSRRWRFATNDAKILEHLGSRHTLKL